MVGSRTRAMENTLGPVVDAEGWPVKGSLSFTATCQGTIGKIVGTNKGGRPALIVREMLFAPFFTESHTFFLFSAYPAPLVNDSLVGLCSN